MKKAAIQRPPDECVAVTERDLHGSKAMRFRFAEENRAAISTERLCRIMNVSSRGYRAFRSRPNSQSQRKDMVLLAHIREQHRLSLSGYGRPRMTEELNELGLNVGHPPALSVIACNHLPIIVVDISYIWTHEGWLYLAVVLDLYSSRVIGWAVSNRMKNDLAIRALDMAVALRKPPKGCIHHSDRGSHRMPLDL
ncbi:MAG: DDE-type integrase/transposase/recombinase [Rhodobacteraceae bacterium]|nr:DDE-type integrase/transposase/recombinase [Paracoccaceae bacterium]